jgi:L-ribulokinase
VTRRPLYLIGSDQGPALGSAIHAAVAAGRYPDVPAAAAVMGRSTPAAYQPEPARADAYDALYAEYVTLHDLFGRAGGGTGGGAAGDDVMHRLRARRNEVLRARHATGVA